MQTPTLPPLPPTQPQSSYSIKPRPKTVNFRLVVLLSVVALLMLRLVVYPIVKFQLTRGIEHHADYEKVDLKQLGFFHFDNLTGTTEQIPNWCRALDGKRVQLEGFPWDPNGNRTDFQFVYNVGKCCFNGPPLVQERVFARMASGQPLPDDMDYGRLTGILHVKVERSGGVITSIFRLDVDKSETIR